MHANFALEHSVKENSHCVYHFTKIQCYGSSGCLSRDDWECEMRRDIQQSTFSKFSVVCNPTLGVLLRHVTKCVQIKNAEKQPGYVKLTSKYVIMQGAFYLFIYSCLHIYLYLLVLAFIGLQF